MCMGTQNTLNIKGRPRQSTVKGFATWSQIILRWQNQRATSTKTDVQTNVIEQMGQESNPLSNSHLTSYNTHKRKCTAFVYWCQENRLSPNWKIKGHPSLSPSTHINYKRTEDLHVMPINRNYRKGQVKQFKMWARTVEAEPGWGKQVIENVCLKGTSLPLIPFCILTIMK